MASGPSLILFFTLAAHRGSIASGEVTVEYCGEPPRSPPSQRGGTETIPKLRDRAPTTKYNSTARLSRRHVPQKFQISDLRFQMERQRQYPSSAAADEGRRQSQRQRKLLARMYCTRAPAGKDEPPSIQRPSNSPEWVLPVPK
jgi:hypothetical protein